VACLSVGATIGFLFGIPRSGGQTSDSRQQKDPEKIDATNTSTLSKQESETISRPNTNLEEVSDWLTKILVGLTLVHLKSIEGHVMSISQNAAASFNPTPTNADVSAATALVVGFAVIGFLCGYLYTRLFLQGAFIRSDRDMGASRAAIAKELASTSLGAAPISGEPSIPSQSDRKAAERVLEVVPPDRPDEVLPPLRELAAEYERVRQEMPFGDERTRKMAEIVSRMKRLALVAIVFLPELTQSASPGERLAAVIILQMKFDPQYIEWLAKRLVTEPAFCGYQAASALLNRIRIVGGPERQRIRAAVKAAKEERAQLNLPSDYLDDLVEKIITDEQPR
jgi:hypothetical protein